MDSTNPESSLNCFGTPLAESSPKKNDSSFISKEIVMSPQIRNSTSISLDEFKWNMKRLLREIHPKGILLHDLEEIYYHWFHKNLVPDMFHVSSLVPDTSAVVDHSCVGWNWIRVFKDQPSLHQTFVVKAIDNGVYKLILRPGSFTPEETKLVMAATEYSMCKLLTNQRLLVQEDKSCGTEIFQDDKSCGTDIFQANKSCGTDIFRKDKSCETDKFQKDKSCGTDKFQKDKSCGTDLPHFKDSNTQYCQLQKVQKMKDIGTETDRKTMCEAQIQTMPFLIKIPARPKSTAVSSENPAPRNDTNEHVVLNNVNISGTNFDLDETLPAEIPINTLSANINVNITDSGNVNMFNALGNTIISSNQETELQNQIVGEDSPPGDEDRNTKLSRTSIEDARNNGQSNLPFDTTEPVTSSTSIESSSRQTNRIQSLGNEASTIVQPDVVSVLQQDNLSLKLASPDDCNNNLKTEIPLESRAQSLRKMISSSRRRESEKTHKCTYNGCKRSFDTVELRQKHVIEVHLLKGLKHKCNVDGCKNVFSKEEDMLRHIALCSLALSRKRRLDSESSSSKSKPSKSIESNNRKRSHSQSRRSKDSDDIDIIELSSSSSKRFKHNIDASARPPKDYYSINDTERKGHGSGSSYDDSRNDYHRDRSNGGRKRQTPTDYVSRTYQSRDHSSSRRSRSRSDHSSPRRRSRNDQYY